MPQFLKDTLAFGIPTWLVGTWFLSSDVEVITSAVFAFIIAAIFGPCMAYLLSSFAGEMRGKCELVDGETIVFESRATLRRGWSGISGWLYLTNRHLRFRSLKVNLKNVELAVPLNQIEAVSKVMSLGVIPNAIAIEQANETERFALPGRGRWAQEIRSAMGAPPLT